MIKTINGQYRSGFTLLELLMIIAILGILSSVILGSLNSAQKKAYVTKAEQTILQFEKAILIYELNNGKLPGIDDTWIQRYGDCQGDLSGFNSTFDPINDDLSPYLNNELNLDNGCLFYAVGYRINDYDSIQECIEDDDLDPNDVWCTYRYVIFHPPEFGAPITDTNLTNNCETWMSGEYTLQGASHACKAVIESGY